MADSIQTTNETSEDTKTIITVLLLIFLFPVGFIVMWFWPKWKTWVKLLISFPLLLILLVFIGLLMAGFFVAFNPSQAFKKGQCTTQCGGVKDLVCINDCMGTTSNSTTGVLGKYPAEVRTSFIESCAKTSGQQKYCECTYNYIEKNLSLEEFSKGASNPNSGEFGKVVQEAITSCAKTVK